MELLDIVDSEDRVIGRATKEDARAQGLLHRAIDIVLVRDGKLLLQQRSQRKRSLPGAWDVSVSGHVQSGESYEAAAARELKEELGIDAELVRAREAHLQVADERLSCPKELTALFLGNHAGPFTVQKAEVAQVRWFPFAEVRTMVAKRTVQLTPWFLEEWEWLSQRLR